MIEILVVDDQSTVCQVLTNWLDREKDFQVVGVARNGSEALLKVSQLRPEIVVMELNMPKMNGLEATEAILRHYPDVKVIALSGDELNHLQSLCLGATLYLPKDITAVQLATRIREVKNGYFHRNYRKNSIQDGRVAAIESETEVKLSRLDDDDELKDIEAEIEAISTSLESTSTEATQKSDLAPGEPFHRRFSGNQLDRTELELAQLFIDGQSVELLENLLDRIEVEIIDSTEQLKIAMSQSRKSTEELLLHHKQFSLQIQHLIAELQTPELFNETYELHRQIRQLNHTFSDIQKKIILQHNLTVLMIVLLVIVLLFFCTFGLLWS